MINYTIPKDIEKDAKVYINNVFRISKQPKITRNIQA